MSVKRIQLMMFVLSCSLVAGLAEAQHSDIEIEVEEGAVITEPRIAEGEFGEGLSASYSLNEPGFEADDGMLSPGDLVHITIPSIEIDGVSRSLWFWDGAGEVDFGAAAHELRATNPGSSESMQIDGVDPGGELGLAVADPDGGLHQDLVWDLVDTAGTGVDPPDPGVYLWATHVMVEPAASPGARLISDPLYWVAGAGVDEAVLDQAVDFVHRRLVIPEPSAIVLLVVGSLVGLGWRGRKGRSQAST